MDVVVRTYREGDERDIVELLKVCFDDFSNWGLTPEDWLLYESLDYGISRGSALVAEVGGRVVGHLQVVLRKVYIGDALVDVCGIANVCTHPEFRGRGIATRLVSEALKLCRSRGLPIASLLTGYASEGYRVYRALGFSNTGFLNFYIGTRESVERLLSFVKPVELDVAEVDEESLASIEEVHQEFCRSVNLTVWRPREYWVEKVLRRFFYYSFFYDKPNAALVTVFRESSRVVGYSLAFRGYRQSRRYWPANTAVVLEVASTDPRYTPYVLAETLRKLYNEGAKVFTLYLPKVRDLLPALRFFEEFKGAFLMDYVLSVEGLLKSLVPELRRRARALTSSLDIDVNLRCSYGCANLRVVGGEVDVGGGCTGRHYLDLTNDGLVRVLYGVNSLRQVLSEGLIKEVYVDCSTLKSLVKLLHRRPYYIPRTDQW